MTEIHARLVQIEAELQAARAAALSAWPQRWRSPAQRAFEEGLTDLVRRLDGATGLLHREWSTVTAAYLRPPACLGPVPTLPFWHEARPSPFITADGVR